MLERYVPGESPIIPPRVPGSAVLSYERVARRRSHELRAALAYTGAAAAGVWFAYRFLYVFFL
jgi:hypothetical protein